MTLSTIWHECFDFMQMNVFDCVAASKCVFIHKNEIICEQKETKENKKKKSYNQTPRHTHTRAQVFLENESKFSI